MVITNQKPIVDTQKLKKKGVLPKKVIKTQGKKQKEEGMNKELQNQPENNRTIVST